jgi:hypothetical protein
MHFPDPSSLLPASPFTVMKTYNQRCQYGLTFSPSFSDIGQLVPTISEERYTQVPNRDRKKELISSKTLTGYWCRASATVAIVPDDGPMWPKHVVLM